MVFEMTSLVVISQIKVCFRFPLGIRRLALARWLFVNRAQPRLSKLLDATAFIDLKQRDIESFP